MAQGLQIKVCDLPQSHRAKVRLEPAEKGVLYRLEWRDNKRRDPDLHIVCLRSEDCGPDGEMVAAMHRCLLELPEDVVAIDYSALGLGVYWRERGSLEQVAVIKGALEQLRLSLA